MACFCWRKNVLALLLFDVVPSFFGYFSAQFRDP